MSDTDEDPNGSGEQTEQEPIRGVGQLVERIDSAASERSRLSVGDVLDEVGHRAFVPLLLVPGLVMLAPVIGDIPGVPVLMGIIVILVCVQLLLHRERIWLPGWLRHRTVSSSKVHKTLGWLRRPARFMDRWTRRRYVGLVNHASFYIIAVVCIIIAAATPLMEVVPFSANVAGVAITAFALALLTQDGLLAMLAIACSLATAGLMIYQFI